MIDVTQPITLQQEPSAWAEGWLGAHGGTLEYRAIHEVLQWVLLLPPDCTVIEHLRYRTVVQYHIHLPDSAVFTLCANTNEDTGEVSNVIVVPREGV